MKKLILIEVKKLYYIQTQNNEKNIEGYNETKDYSDYLLSTEQAAQTLGSLLIPKPCQSDVSHVPKSTPKIGVLFSNVPILKAF